MQITEKHISIIHKLIQEYGENVIAGSSQIESLLSDLSPDTLKENHLIALSFKSGFAKAYLFREDDSVESLNALTDTKNILSDQYSLKDDALIWIENFWSEFESFQKFTKMDYVDLRTIYLENLKLKEELSMLKKKIDNEKSFEIEYNKLRKAYDKVYQVYYDEMKK